MVFSSHLFVYYFLPLALVVYAVSWKLLPRSLRHLGLLLVSYLFYGWANPAFVGLMLFSTVVDYACGLAIDDSSDARRRKLAVTVSVITNLAMLGFFKYWNFGVDSYNATLTALGLAELRFDSVLRITLPLGISFYTFQSMSYTIDIYRGRCRALRNPIDFASYVAMFPQLVAGPIIRFQEVADQLRERQHSLHKVARGVAFFSLGLTKKIMLANPCGKIADLAFESRTLTLLDAWYGALAYSFQIYFDFSGYSDMAIGLGLLLGFRFPKNFDSPYRSASITEFWRRWHMSLSRWLRDYLYISLGGNRRGRRRTYVNLMLVMLLGGLWHGAAWTFVAWGAIHGTLLAIERWRRDRAADSTLDQRLPRALRVGVTFLFVLIAWVFFRASDLTQAVHYLAAMLGQANEPAAALASTYMRAPYLLWSFVVAALITWTAPQTWDWSERLSLPKAFIVIVALISSLIMMDTQGYNPFIYFIF